MKRKGVDTNCITVEDSTKNIKVIVTNNTRDEPYYKWQVPDDIHIKLYEGYQHTATFCTYDDGYMEHTFEIITAVMCVPHLKEIDPKVETLIEKHATGKDLTFDENSYLKSKYGLEICPHERIRY